MGKERIIISFHEDEPSQQGIISGIKSLQSSGGVPKKPKEKKEEKEEEPFLLTSMKNRVKEKKKKKKKSSDLTDLAHFVGLSEPNEDGAKKERIVDSLEIYDVDDILNRGMDDDDDDSLSDGIIDEQKRNYEKLKREENPFKKEFAEPMGLLYDLLDETAKFSKELDKSYKAMENSKVRGSSKYKNDLLVTMLQAKASRLSIIKEITSTKKTIQDLNIKATKDTKETESSKSNEAVAAAYIQQIMGGQGRSNFVKDLQNGINYNPEQGHLDRLVNELGAPVSTEPDNIDDLIEDRLDEIGNPFRSDNGSVQIMYENTGANVWVRRYIEDNTWDFVALDRDGREIAGYPVPDTNFIKINFSSDYSHATDNLGRSYKVLEVYE